MKVTHLIPLCIGLAIAAINVATAKPAGTTGVHSVCSALRAAVTSGEKDASGALADKMSEDSAARAMLEQEAINTAYAEIQDNLALMGQHHCPPISRPISDQIFIGNALACSGDRTKASIDGSTTLPASCDRSSWRPYSVPQ